MRESSRERKRHAAHNGMTKDQGRTLITSELLGTQNVSGNCQGLPSAVYEGRNEVLAVGKQSIVNPEDGPAPVYDIFIPFKEITSEYDEFEENEVTIPISTCLSVFFCYILFGSILFSWWEGWEYFEGSYFCFVSLVTIGFSDMVPGQSRARGFRIPATTEPVNIAHALANGEGMDGDRNTEGRTTGETSASGSNGPEESLDHVDGQLILCSIYILFGMALMAMCFHLTQERFFTTARKLGKELHLI